MYICNDCGAMFEAPRTATDYVTFAPRPMGYTVYACPRCGSDEIEALITIENKHKEETNEF